MDTNKMEVFWIPLTPEKMQRMMSEPAEKTVIEWMDLTTRLIKIKFQHLSKALLSNVPGFFYLGKSQTIIDSGSAIKYFLIGHIDSNIVGKKLVEVIIELQNDLVKMIETKTK